MKAINLCEECYMLGHMKEATRGVVVVVGSGKCACCNANPKAHGKTVPAKKTVTKP